MTVIVVYSVRLPTMPQLSSDRRKSSAGESPTISYLGPEVGAGIGATRVIAAEPVSTGKSRLTTVVTVTHTVFVATPVCRVSVTVVQSLVVLSHVDVTVLYTIEVTVDVYATNAVEQKVFLVGC